MKRWYPLFLDLAGVPVLVVGGGKIALRKTRGLVECGARVKVVSLQFDPGFTRLAAERIERAFQAGDLDGVRLVFAATNVREVNRTVGELARERGIWANIADAREECAFHVPARVNRDGVQIAISTGGADPARAAGIRKQLEDYMRMERARAGLGAVFSRRSSSN